MLEVGWWVVIKESFKTSSERRWVKANIADRRERAQIVSPFCPLPKKLCIYFKIHAFISSQLAKRNIKTLTLFRLKGACGFSYKCKIWYSDTCYNIEVAPELFLDFCLRFPYKGKNVQTKQKYFSRQNC